ncbi:MAG: glycosyltransferase family 2 protein [Actinomycetota bacterium]
MDHPGRADRVLLRAAGAGSVSIVIPAYNEEDNLAVVLEACLEALKGLASYEVIVVDDASTDRTVGIAEEYAARYPSVKLIRMASDVGPHLCVLTGFREAKGDLLFFLPADRQVMPDQLPGCLDAMAEADYVCTRRVPRKDPVHRRAMAWLYNGMLRVVFRLPIHDVDSCVLLRRSVVEQVGRELVSGSTFILAELLIRARAAGFRVTEVPIEHHPRVAGRPSAITPREVARTVTDFAASLPSLFGVYRSVRRGRRIPGDTT